jgi:hypothetical protein
MLASKNKAPRNMLAITRHKSGLQHATLTADRGSLGQLKKAWLEAQTLDYLKPYN